ncbi:excalibur calcium-binding domain-containing protein [Lysobacter sp. S4-A87]|uniref:excalibur calcium-binding domain-containing protein n=1 Tax=Lysobacter sp. S4-A87 TaxID=2925843 RepID=UPI001F52F748|nr:excalibur calcium-binding domain-containing protein [Lysobacter sp. S4-A87]UNK50566.1 excalibur calcium-binding domain-containing protein [Lysobacter sp. S4-A87]
MRPLVFSLLSLLTAPGWETAHAHGGGLDKNGCHTNRKTGDHHCHRGPAVSALSSMDRLSPASLDESRKSNPSQAFRNCAEARAAGAAPVRRGEAGYGSHLDRDGDGVGCEPYHGR